MEIDPPVADQVTAVLLVPVNGPQSAAVTAPVYPSTNTVLLGVAMAAIACAVTLYGVRALSAAPTSDGSGSLAPQPLQASATRFQEIQ